MNEKKNADMDEKCKAWGVNLTYRKKNSDL